MCGPDLSWGIAAGGRCGGLRAPLVACSPKCLPCTVLGEEDLGRRAGNASNVLLAPRSSGELCLPGESDIRPLLLAARGCCRGRGTLQSSALCSFLFRFLPEDGFAASH